MKFLSAASLLALLTLMSLTTQAQNEHLNTPIEADIIFTLRGENVLKKVPLKELKTLPMLDQFFQQIADISGTGDKDVEKLGIDLNANAQYFMDFKEDGTMIMGISFMVNDPDKYKSVFFGDAEVINEEGLEFTSANGYTRSLRGNEGMVVYAVMSPSYNDYEYDYSIAEIEAESDIYYEEELMDEEVAIPEMEEVDEPTEDTIIEYDEEIVEYEEPVYDMEEEVEYEMEEIESDDYEEFDYEAWAAEEEAKRKEEEAKTAHISKDYMLKLFSDKSLTVSQKDFTSELIDPNADMSFIVSNYASIYEYMNNMTGDDIYYYDPFMSQMNTFTTSMYSQTEWISGNAYYDKDEFRIEMNTKLNENSSKWNSKIMDREFNPEMLKYIPYDDHLGFITASYNTENMFYAGYDMMRDFFQNSEIGMDTTLAAVVDFYDLFLDEKAIGNLFKGDLYFGVTDINTYEVEYTSYEYDDNWNYSEVTKTRDEVRPDFLLMFSSDDYKNINNICKMIESFSDGHFKNYGDYYKLSSDEKAPLDIYSMHKDGVVFIFTSELQFQKIQNGGSNSNNPQKKDITSNSMNINLDAGKLMNKIPLTDMSDKEREEIILARERLSNITLKQGTMKNDILSTQINMETSGDYKNSLDYFLQLFNDISEIEKTFSTYRN